MSMTWGEVTALLTAVVALFSLIYRFRPERKKTEAETAASYAGTARSLLEQVERLRVSQEGTETALEDSEESARRLEDLLSQCRQENALLKKIAPGLVRQLLLSANLSEDVAWLLDQTGILWFISSPVQTDGKVGPNATVLWASAGWEVELGRPREALCGTGWWELLHPADRKKTAQAEAGALMQRVRVGNRYLCGDGVNDLCLDWRALPYDPESGLTLAVAIVVGREPRNGGGASS